MGCGDAPSPDPDVAGAPVALARVYRDRAQMNVAGGTTAIVVEREPLPGPLAEYQRAVTLERNGRAVARAALFMDTGGYSRANLYAMPSGAYRLRDADEAYTLDVARATITLDSTRALKGAFVGSFDEDSTGVWRFIPSSERGELPTELSGG
jgi:hypothetical protein